MIKHVILWKLNGALSQKEKEQAKNNAKSALEALAGKIPGLLSIKVEISPLPSSNADMMLDTEFESEEALLTYQSHPLHVSAANTYVRPFTETRLCLDFKA